MKPNSLKKAISFADRPICRAAAGSTSASGPWLEKPRGNASCSSTVVVRGLAAAVAAGAARDDGCRWASVARSTVALDEEEGGMPPGTAGASYDREISPASSEAGAALGQPPPAAVRVAKMLGPPIVVRLPLPLPAAGSS